MCDQKSCNPFAKLYVGRNSVESLFTFFCYCKFCKIHLSSAKKEDFAILQNWWIISDLLNHSCQFTIIVYSSSEANHFNDLSQVFNDPKFQLNSYLKNVFRWLWRRQHVELSSRFSDYNFDTFFNFSFRTLQRLSIPGSSVADVGVCLLDFQNFQSVLKLW